MILMNSHEFSLIHENVPHGTIRFHLKIHDFTSDPSWSERVSSHWHEEYELMAVTEGYGAAHINNHRFEIRTGDILFINSGDVHSFSAEPGVPLTFYAIVFGRELISSYGNDDIQQKYIQRQTNGELLFQDHFHPEDPGWQELSSLMEEIHHTYQSQDDGYELLIKADLLRIWYLLCRYPSTSPISYHRNDDSRIVLTKEIIQYIRDNYSANLTLPELAYQFHMSEGQFCRFFKAQVNMTAIEYLNYYRIGVACDMLEDDSISVSTVALECGYNNISYFNRTFRRYMHCTPKEYRSQKNDPTASV